MSISDVFIQQCNPKPSSQWFIIPPNKVDPQQQALQNCHHLYIYIYIYIYVGSVWEYDTLYKSSQSQSIRNIKQQTKLGMLYDCGPRHKIWQLGSSAILSCSPHSNCHMLVVHRPFSGQTHIIYDGCMSPTNIPWLVQPFNRPIHMWVVIVVKPSIWAKWGSFSISK